MALFEITVADYDGCDERTLFLYAPSLPSALSDLRDILSPSWYPVQGFKVPGKEVIPNG